MREPGERGVCLIDGEEVRGEAAATLPLTSRALFGWGLYETFGVFEGRVLDRDAHLDRLRAGAARMQVPLPAPATLDAWLDRAVAAIPRARGWLRVLATEEKTVVSGGPEPAGERSASAVLLPWRRSLHDPLAGVKHLGCGANLAGIEHARRLGADEGIWCNARGHLAEGCRANLFVVRGRTLATPGEGEGILPGVTRGVVLDVAREHGVRVRVGKVRLPFLTAAREAFLTSSVLGIRPLVRFEGRPVGDGTPGPLTRRLLRWVAARRGNA